MDNPERQLAQSTDILQRATSTESHTGSDAVGIGATDIHRAIATQAHAQHIHTSGITGIMSLHPVEHIHDLLRTPSTAWILGNDGQCIDVTPFDDGIERSISSHPIQISATKTCPMQEDDDRCLFHGIKIIDRCINPEVVTSRNLILHCPEVVERRHFEGSKEQY